MAAPHNYNLPKYFFNILKSFTSIYIPTFYKQQQYVVFQSWKLKWGEFDPLRKWMKNEPNTTQQRQEMEM